LIGPGNYFLRHIHHGSVYVLVIVDVEGIALLDVEKFYLTSLASAAGNPRVARPLLNWARDFVSPMEEGRDSTCKETIAYSRF
jgi:hypothetical protein